VATGITGWLGYLSGLAYVEHGVLFFGIAALAAVVRGLGHGHAAPRNRWFLLAGLLAGLASGCKYTAAVMVAAPLALGLLVAGGAVRSGALRLFVFVAGWAVSFGPWAIKNAAMTGNPVFPLTNGVFRAYPPGWDPAQQEQWDRGHAFSDGNTGSSSRLSALWTHSLGDRYQRLGPALLLLALGGLLGRRRDRVDLVLLCMLITQVTIWLAFTHLYARFLIPVLIPLGGLCGRAAGQPAAKGRGALLAMALALGGVWNLYHEIRLHRAEGVGGAPASLFYEGKVPGFEYLGFVNRELPPDARLLMIGDARPFYIQRPAAYATAFNASPSLKVLETAGTEGLSRWLLESGNTHVLVNWAEIQRLRRTYGFADAATPQVFAALSRSTLTLVKSFANPRSGERYIDLYAVRAMELQAVPDGP
jgi:hypothetical protein